MVCSCLSIIDINTFFTFILSCLDVIGGRVIIYLVFFSHLCISQFALNVIVEQKAIRYKIRMDHYLPVLQCDLYTSITASSKYLELFSILNLAENLSQSKYWLNLTSYFMSCKYARATILFAITLYHNFICEILLKYAEALLSSFILHSF